MALPTYLPFIHNEWVKTYKSVTVRNPYNQKKIAKVYLADGDFLDMAVESSLMGFKYARQLSGYDRYELLMGIVKGLEKREEEFIDTIIQEGGKPVRFARNEVHRAKLTFTWAAEEARRLNGEYLPLDMAPQTRGYFGISKRFPLGVVLGISPFNFPLNLVAHKMAPALASGNSIIMKPASQTPITLLKLGKILQDIGMPAGMVNILPASGKTAENLVRDGRIKKLSFTGSASVGWYLKSIAGKKHVTLELGGNAGVIVEPDTDLDSVIPRLVTGSFAYSGQICISIQRIYVHQDIFEAFIDKFAREVRKNVISGDPAKEKTMIGPMIDTDAAKTAQKWVEEAVKEGATLIMGGKAEKNFMEPTILTGTSPDMKAVCEEIFAPVVSIEPYRNFSDALNMMNNAHYGLQAGIYSNNFNNIQQAYDELDVGAVVVNDYPTFRIDPMPYGGVKDSGFGREGIRYAIESMTEIKLLAVKGYKSSSD